MGTAETAFHRDTLTNVQLLDLSYDGHVPAHVRAEAARLDAKRQRARPSAARVRGTVTALKPKGQVECMTLALISVRAGRGRATEADLRRLGFSPRAIALYGDRASARAAEIWCRDRGADRVAA